QVSPDQYRYFAVREQVEHVRDFAAKLGEEIDAVRSASSGYPKLQRPDRPRRGRKKLEMGHKLPWAMGDILREMASALDINEYRQELVSTAVVAGEAHADELQDLLGHLALLQVLADCLRSPSAERVVLCPVALGADKRDWKAQLLNYYESHLPALRL